MFNVPHLGDTAFTFLCLQVCAILQRPSVRTHKNQQQASVPASRYHARHTQLWVQRRWVSAAAAKCAEGAQFLLENISIPMFILLHRLPSLPEDLPGNAASLYVRNIVWKLLFQFSVVCVWIQGKDDPILNPDWILTRHSYCCYYSNVQGDSNTSICITIEPGLLLKGDILVRLWS